MDVIVLFCKAEVSKKRRKELRRALLQNYQRVLWKQPRRALDSMLSPFLPKWKSLEARIQLMVHYERLLASIADPNQVVVLESCVLEESLKCTTKEWSYLCHKFDINPFAHAENCYQHVLIDSSANTKEQRLMLGHHRALSLPAENIVNLFHTPTTRYLVSPSAARRLTQNSITVMQEEVFHQDTKSSLVKRNRQESYSHFLYKAPRHTRLSDDYYQTLLRETSGKRTLKKISHFRICGEFAKVETFIQPPLEMSILELPSSVPLPDKLPVIGTV